jgi:SAM-dependent methyltransferase
VGASLRVPTLATRVAGSFMPASEKAMTCRICDRPSGESPLTSLYLSPTVRKQLVRCSHCDSAYFVPPPTSAEIATCYRGAYREDFVRTHGKNKERGALLARRFAVPGSSGRFLDVGCSLGSMMEGFRDACGWTVVGTEFDEDAARRCRERGLEVVSGLLYDCDDLGKFDLILANNVLEHEPDPSRFLDRIRELLHPQGKLILNVPHGPTDIYPSLRLRELGCEEVGTFNEGHVCFFGVRGLRDLLTRTGFAVESLSPFHFKMGLRKRMLLPGSLSKMRRVCIRERGLRDVQEAQTDGLPQANAKEWKALPTPLKLLANDLHVVCRPLGCKRS